MMVAVWPSTVTEGGFKRVAYGACEGRNGRPDAGGQEFDVDRIEAATGWVAVSTAEGEVLGVVGIEGRAGE